MNSVGKLSNLLYTWTVDEYCDKFEECFSRHTRLVCGGVTDSLRKMEYFRLETIFEAMEYSRNNEYKANGDKRTRTFGGHMVLLARQLVPIARPRIAGNNMGQGRKDGGALLPQKVGTK